MEDILLHASILEWVGINFNQTEWYKIRLAMKKLLIENKCEFIRFFGKIYGINSDYYIIQGICKDYPMKNLPKHVESRGNEGINRFTFYRLSATRQLGEVEQGNLLYLVFTNYFFVE